MSTTYTNAEPGNEVFGLMAEIIAEHYPDLEELEVEVGVMFAFNPKGPAVKLHGRACAAVIKINSLKARAEGLPDATITIDGHLWGRGDEKLPRRRRIALLDHELHHLVVVHDKNGDPVADDLGRPKLKMKPHDFEVGWFRVIAERHGRDSFEVEQAAKLTDEHGQLLFPWAAKTDEAESQFEVSIKLADGRTTPFMPFQSSANS